MKKWIKRLVLLLVVVVVIIVGIKIIKGNPDSNANIVVNDYTVELGTIDSTISGKAIIQPNDQYTITTSVSGDILKTYFKEGDVVEKDSIMFEIDSSDVAKSIESSALNMEKANMNLDNINDSISDLVLKSDYSGITTNVNVKVGDTKIGWSVTAVYIAGTNSTLVNGSNALTLSSGGTYTAKDGTWSK